MHTIRHQRLHPLSICQHEYTHLQHAKNQPLWAWLETADICVRRISQSVCWLGCCLQDIAQLRKLAAVRGLVSAELRAKLWPCLLAGADGCSTPSAAATAGSVSQSTAAWPSRRSSFSDSPNSSSAGGNIAGRSRLDEQQYLRWAAGAHKDSSTVSATLTSKPLLHKKRNQWRLWGSTAVPASRPWMVYAVCNG